MTTLTARLDADALDPTQFGVASVSAHEAVSQLYEVRIRVVGAAGAVLNEEALLGARVRLTLLLDEVPVRYLSGVVHRIEAEWHSEASTLSWDLVLVPRAFALTLGTTTEIAMDATVPEIVEERLVRLGLQPGDDFELVLQERYEKREFVVQFRETHAAFVSRLCEHLGITYFFRQTERGEVLTFADRNAAFVTESDDLRVAFRPRGERADIFELRSATCLVPAQLAIRDYNYRTPAVDLAAAGHIESAWGEQFEHGDHFKTPEEAARLLKIRQEELTSRKRVFHGKSARAEMSPGTRLRVEGHPSGDLMLLILSVDHRLDQAVFGTVGGGYENRFTAIEASVPFRPERLTPRPFVPGVLTATVEAEQAGDYAEVDGQGRYHVRFAFDRGKAARGKASRPIRMAQPHAGAGYGFHFPLRDGVEVLITCVEGDPDRPIIAGAVPNPSTPSTVTEKNAVRNVIRTGGGTELNIEDTVGSERLKITVPFGNTVFQMGAPNAPTPGMFMGTDNTIRTSSKTGMYIEDGMVFFVTAPQTIISASSEAQLNAIGSTKVHSDGVVGVTAPTITQAATGRYQESAPLVLSSAKAVWSATSGGVLVVHAGGTVNVSAPTVSIQGSAVAIEGSTIEISATGSVSVTAPDVTVNGAGTVNVVGGVIKLNS